MSVDSGSGVTVTESAFGASVSPSIYILCSPRRFVPVAYLQAWDRNWAADMRHRVTKRAMLEDLQELAATVAMTRQQAESLSRGAGPEPVKFVWVRDLDGWIRDWFSSERAHQTKARMLSSLHEFVTSHGLIWELMADRKSV